MTARTFIALLLLAAGILIAYGLRSGDHGEPPTAPPVAAAPRTAPPVPIAAGAESEPIGERSAIAIAPTPAIHGIVTRHGIPVAGREVRCRDLATDRTTKTRTAIDGSYDFAVGSGNFEVSVEIGQGVTRAQHSYRSWPMDDGFRLCAAAAKCTVDAAAVRLDLELRSQTIVVRALDARTLAPIAGADAVWRPPPPWTEELQLTTDAAGTARFDEIMPGRHTVAVTARAFRMAQMEVELPTNAPNVTRDLLLEPIGALDVVLVDESGDPLEISAALEIRALHDLSAAVIEPSNGDAFRKKPRPRVVRFDELLPGHYRIALGRDDVTAAGEPTIRFQPVVVDSPAEVDVVAGRVARCEVRAHYRCYAVLRGVDQTGKSVDASLRVEWLDPVTGATRVLPAPWQQGGSRRAPQFEGYLESGTYALTFTASEKVWRESLTVHRAAVDRTFTIPW
ncbi:MAG: hypothetical protein KDE27_15875 [Planctomycetes bacterium]|nr:hypothetical protein [Planctomycetota bacterium]